MKLRTALLSAAFALAASTAAQADTDVVVKADEAKMLAVSGTPVTVVVGNPNIADVTFQNNNLFIHGRNYGSTNVIVLDSQGNQLAALAVTVMLNGSHNVNVFRAGAKYSYACADICESAIQVGDAKDYFDTLEQQNTKKKKLATEAGQ
jgi:Flp pilus assembly secretin CpaC